MNGPNVDYLMETGTLSGLSRVDRIFIIDDATNEGVEVDLVFTDGTRANGGGTETPS